MDFITLLLETGGIWGNLINGVEGFVKNYGLTLILITIIIKFAMLPFDFINKMISRKNSRIQAKMQPELEKIKKAYANNPQMVNQKTMELYKRDNYSIMGTCFGMLINLVLTSVVFLTLFSSLRAISYEKQANQFIALSQEYTQTYNQEIDGKPISEELQLHAQNVASEAVVLKYDEIKDSFLWIKNIWKADTTTSVTLSYKEFSSNAKDLIYNESTNPNGVTEEFYNQVMKPIKEKYSGANGYYILTILSAGTTYLSFKITTFTSKRKAKKNGTVFVDPMGNSKALLFIMPILMAIFTLQYNSAFGIYIVAGSLFGMITSPLMGILVETIDNKNAKKNSEKNVVSYSRKR